MILKLRQPKKLRLLVVFTLLIGISCNRNGEEKNTDLTTQNTIKIDINDQKQTIRNFGASDAWTCQFVGLWPDTKRNQVADWLFSVEEDENGKPKGIGLSLWRFNIGAGSTAQKNISDEWRSTEGFLNDDLSYDWTRQSGQRWFMHAAKSRGVDEFVGFTNSPPVQITKNAKAFSGNGENANIFPSKYLSFAKFLVTVSKRFAEEGISFNYISPFNEPQWDWTGNGQEGSPYTNQEIFQITKKLDSLITNENLSVKIQISEAGKLNYLYEIADKPTRGDQIQDFFNSASPRYLGNFENVDKIISGHSYFTSAPIETLKDVRQNLARKLNSASVPLEFWQSEYCILGNQEEVPGQGKDTGITTALYVARLIHHDLVEANAAAWHWWLAVSAYDYKDGLIYVDKNKTDGEIDDTRLLWALGNYSRFIRPGSVRVGVSSENVNIHNPNGLMVSSFVNTRTNKLVTVIINYAKNDASFKIQVKGKDEVSFKPYITGPGDDEELKPLPAISSNEVLTIPKKSIITFVNDL